MRSESRVDWLLVSLLVYSVASLFHYVHNAVFIDAYPNLPNWISATGVYAAWLAIAAIGVMGGALLRGGWRILGLLVLGVYAGCGFDGLGHYYLAPMAQHTLAMNLSIWSEVITATVALLVVSGHLVAQLRSIYAATPAGP